MSFQRGVRRHTIFTCVWMIITAQAAVCPDSDTSCLADPHLEGSESVSASLLQRASRQSGQVWTHDAQTPPSLMNLCDGVAAQGKCWYLSEVGKSCFETCSANGKAFDFVVASKTDSLIPKLLGRTPNVQQWPWAALECFAPEEDRWHTASVKASQLQTGDIGLWARPECQLACPCSDVPQCKWKSDLACVPQFMYNELIYNDCTIAGSSKPWCATKYRSSFTQALVDSASQGNQDWKPCTQLCGPDADVPEMNAQPPKSCRWQAPAACAPEFEFQGIYYVGCTTVGGRTPWCSIDPQYVGSWTNCGYSCMDETVSVPDASVLCSWEAAADCAQNFVYKGVQYTGCAEEDHPTPWCSKNKIHQGDWTTCSQVCRYMANVTVAKCTCSNGLAVADAYCTTDGANICEGCYPGFTLSDSRQCEAQLPQENVCTCIGGTAVLDANCPINGSNLCASCNDGYTLNVAQQCEVSTTIATTITTTIAATTTIPMVSNADPCARDPNSEDVVGMSVLLDDTGYETLVRMNKPTNMKTFICRVVADMDCKVIDGKHLVEMAQYHCSPDHSEDFHRLERELALLCHQEGMWVAEK